MQTLMLTKTTWLRQYLDFFSSKSRAKNDLNSTFLDSPYFCAKVLFAKSFHCFTVEFMSIALILPTFTVRLDILIVLLSLMCIIDYLTFVYSTNIYSGKHYFSQVKKSVRIYDGSIITQT